jgi:hypothetical protein
MALTGTEVLFVLPVAANGQPAATTEQTTTAAIASLAGAGTSPTFTNITLTGLLYESASNNLTATGTTQGTALALTTEVNRLTTVASGSGVTLPVSAGGLTILVVNNGANSLQVYGAGTDTIDSVASSTGVTQMIGSAVLYICPAAGVWYSEGLATGYAGSLQTFSFINAITAHAGGGQGSATPLTTMVNRVTTVATAGDSVVLPTAAPGMNVTVINSGANSLAVFPAGTDAINAQTASTSFIMQPNSVTEFFTTVVGFWHTVYSANVPQPVVYNTNTATASTTLTAANLAGATVEVDLGLTGTLAGAANATLPTVAALVAAVPNAIAGQTYKLRIINASSGAFTWTVLTNTGWTLTGTMTIAQNTWRDFIVTFTSLSAATLQSVGTGTYS